MFPVFFAALFLMASSALADDHKDLTFLRIGTGDMNGVYAPMGAALANAISHPPGMRTCQEGNNCGVPGLVAVAQSSGGSLDNIKGLQDGRYDTAFVQSDILYWAHEATGLFEGEKPVQNLRVLTSLFNESIHVIVNKWADIKSMEDLKGRRVGVGQKGSDGYIQSQLILETYGMKMIDVQPRYLSMRDAAEKLKQARIDAFILVTGHPSNIISALAEEDVIEILSLDDEKIETLITEHSFFNRVTVAAGTYKNIPEFKTLALPTLWVTTNRLDERLAYHLMRALWHKKTQQTLGRGHGIARQVTYATSFEGIATPIHAGAMVFHEELEIMKAKRIYALDNPKKKGFDFSFGAFADN